MIENESPLRRLPARLERRQVLFFDGLRLSAQALGSARRRLAELLPLLEVAEPNSSVVNDLVVEAGVQAWGIVDATFRFRRLLAQFPKLKKNLPAVQLFERRTTEVEWFRNFIQHLLGEVDAIATAGRPLLGTVTWIHTSADGQIHFHTAVPGTFYSSARAEAAPYDFENPNDGVWLAVAGRVLCLSAMVDAVEAMIRCLEADLRMQFAEEPPSMADIFTSVILTPCEDGQ